MRCRTRFRNRNDVTAADCPGQGDSRRRATMSNAYASKRGITQQACARAAERRISHHRHLVLLAPWQQVTFNSARADVVLDLVSRTAIATRNAKELLHVPDTEVGDPPGVDLTC